MPFFTFCFNSVSNGSPGQLSGTAGWGCGVQTDGLVIVAVAKLELPNKGLAKHTEPLIGHDPTDDGPETGLDGTKVQVASLETG